MKPENYPYSPNEAVAVGEKAYLSGDNFDSSRSQDWQNGYNQAMETFSLGLFCRECGQNMEIITDGIAHHLHDEDDGIDYDADARHTAVHDHKY